MTQGRRSGTVIDCAVHLSPSMPLSSPVPRSAVNFIAPSGHFSASSAHRPRIIGAYVARRVAALGPHFQPTAGGTYDVDPGSAADLRETREADDGFSYTDVARVVS